MADNYFKTNISNDRIVTIYYFQNICIFFWLYFLHTILTYIYKFPLPVFCYRSRASDLEICISAYCTLTCTDRVVLPSRLCRQITRINNCSFNVPLISRINCPRFSVAVTSQIDFRKLHQFLLSRCTYSVPVLNY